MYFEKVHKEIVKNRGDKYYYISTYEKGDITIDKGKVIKYKSEYMRVRCPYCGEEYDIKVNGFRSGNKCSKCCNSYENSLAYHIQIELGEPLNKYWDWKKNTINPYCVYKHSDIKIWVKCINKDYHDSYETSCLRFCKKYGCPYCSHRGGKIHPKDSFAQYHIDHTDINFLEKYWSDKNTLDPWKLAPKSDKKVWIKCVNKEINPINGIMKMNYHDDYEVSCYNFYKNSRCPYCSTNKGNKVNKYDSYGYLYPEKSKYWDYKKNKKSPFEITPFSKVEYWHICQKCGESFKRSVQNINKYKCGVTCKNCNSSQ